MSSTPLHRVARTLGASGRFLCVLALAGCQTVGTARSEPSEPVGPPPVVLAPGSISGSDQGEAERLLDAAQQSYEARRFFEVLRRTSEIIDDYPASDASGEALRLSARAEFEVGAMDRAEVAAGRYAELLERGDPRGPEMRLMQAAALEGDPIRQLDRLLRIDNGASAAELARAEPQVRALTDSLAMDDLDAVLRSVPTGAPLAAIAEARLSVTLLEYDRVAEAEIYARRAVAGGAEGEELEWAEGVLVGVLPEGRGRTTAFTIAAVLPFGGPPALAEYAALVAEGIEVAAATVLGEEFTVTVVTRDDEGDPLLSAERIQELEAEGVAGIVGLLQDEVLVSAGMARTTAMPIVSPTARSAPRSGGDVYSLEGADPVAAASVAQYAASRAFQRVAIVLPQTPEAAAEADAFEETAALLGIPVAGRFAYQAGATFFEPQILGARDALRRTEIRDLALTEDDTLHAEVLEPTAIFLPVPPEDIEFLAPQVIHFGLDTLAIEILGTSGWSDPQTLAVVDTRLTTGVVATAPIGVSDSSVGGLRFRQAYEEYYQRTLVSPTPAAGYDATLLLLEALRPGRIQPEAVREVFTRLSGVEGATGVLSIVDGQVMRQTELVRIEERVPMVLNVALPPVQPVVDPGPPGPDR